jgi:uncharacterized protein YndB with AHSA1/START domain
LIEAHGSTTISRPIAAVFDYLADARNEPSWLPGAQRVDKLTEGAVGLGTRFRGTYARAGDVDVQIVEFQRPMRVTFRAQAKIVHFDDAVELSEQNGSTELRALMTAWPQGIMRLLAPAMGRTMRRQFEANWRHLKEALEGSGGPTGHRVSAMSPPR